jgi:hypothetical protein
LEWETICFGHTMELSKQAYALCREQDVSGLRAFLEEHAADIDLYLHEQQEYDTRTFNIMGLAAHHESPECLKVMLDFEVDVNNQRARKRYISTHARC